MRLATPLQAGCAKIVNTKVVIFAIIGQPFGDVFLNKKRTRSEDVLHFSPLCIQYSTIFFSIIRCFLGYTCTLHEGEFF